MRYRELDNDGDMQFGNQQGDFLIDSPEAVAQSVMTRLRLWVGEWFIDTSEGTPYEQAMLGKGKLETFEPAIRKRILETDGVTEILELELIWDSAKRKMTVAVEINTEFGSTSLTGVL
jgi:hypothetical protein